MSEVGRQPTISTQAPAKPERSGRILRPPTWKGFMVRRMVDLVVSLPFLIAAVLVPFQALNIDTKNARLLESLHLNGSDPVGELHPSVVGIIPRVIAAVLPDAHAELLLAVLGALLAGALLRILMTTLWQEYTSAPATAVMVGALALSPMFAFLAVTNFSVMLALALFTYGVRGALRLATWNDTESGFRTGLALLLAALSDPLALVCAAVLAMAAPLLQHARDHLPGAKRANVTVMLFPLAAAVMMWMLFELIFYDAPGWIYRFSATLQGGEDRFMYLVDMAQRPGGLVIFGPFLAAVLLTLILRHRAVPLGAFLVMLVITASFVVGLITLADSGVTFVVTMILGILLFPRPRSALASVAVSCVVLALLVGAWWGSLDNPLLSDVINTTVSAWQ